MLKEYHANTPPIDFVMIQELFGFPKSYKFSPPPHKVLYCLGIRIILCGSKTGFPTRWVDVTGQAVTSTLSQRLWKVFLKLMIFD